MENLLSMVQNKIEEQVTHSILLLNALDEHQSYRVSSVS